MHYFFSASSSFRIRSLPGFLFLLPCFLFAQPGTLLNGKVLEETEAGKPVPLSGAAVFWKGSQSGTVTDSLGNFSLPRVTGYDSLVIRYYSWRDKVVAPGNSAYIEVTLNEGLSMEEVEIRARDWSSFISTIDPLHTEMITEKELGKAACCNLGESFTTNATVEVQSSDAASGAREIRMLGLAGRYTQILTEKTGMVRGLGFLYGLNQIPGPWIEGIQISKGTGTVENGYESITGEINLELKKPDRSDRFYLNLYANAFGRTEANLLTSRRFNSKLSSLLSVHASRNNLRMNNSGNGYLNLPIAGLYTVSNRWKYDLPGGLCVVANVKGIWNDILAGQISFNPKTDKGTTRAYGIGVNIRRLEAYTKTGYVFHEHEGRSIGLILSGFVHRQSSYFGLRTWTGDQDYFKANLIWEDVLHTGRNEHKYRAGASFTADQVHESLNDSTWSRKEITAGAFAEYTLKLRDRFTAVMGVRADHHNLFGFLFTPRLHLRLDVTEHTTLRASLGRGYRTPNRVAENMQVLASSRQVIFRDPLKMEQAWTAGISLVQRFTLNGNEASFALDGFSTRFVNQLVVNLEDASRVVFSNLDGSSFSNVIQAEVNAEPFSRLTMKLAGRYQQVRTTFDGTLRDAYLTPRFRALFNTGYEIQRWLFDATLAFTGTQRLPSTDEKPAELRFPAYSPAFVTLNAQVTRKIGSRWEVYVGGENLTNYRQKVPVIAPNDPFGPYFDSAIIWGPTMGALVYAGLRFSIPYAE